MRLVLAGCRSRQHRIIYWYLCKRHGFASRSLHPVGMCARLDGSAFDVERRIESYDSDDERSPNPLQFCLRWCGPARLVGRRSRVLLYPTFSTQFFSISWRRAAAVSNVSFWGARLVRRRLMLVLDVVSPRTANPRDDVRTDVVRRTQTSVLMSQCRRALRCFRVDDLPKASTPARTDSRTFARGRRGAAASAIWPYTLRVLRQLVHRRWCGL